jgi:WD40 repeat protein
MSGIGERTSRTLIELAGRAFEANDFESAARYALAGINGHNDPIIGYDASRAEATLRAAVLNDRKIAILRAHTGPVETLTVAPDGASLLTASGDATARLWDVDTGVVKCTFLIYGPPAKNCGIAGYQNGAGPAEDDSVEAQVEAEMPAFAEFSRGGNLVLTAKGTVARLWDAETGALLHEYLHGDDESASGIQSATLSPDDKFVLTASLDNSVGLWSSQSGSLVHELKAHTDYARSAVFSPDGSIILSVGNDSAACIWNAVTGELIYKNTPKSGPLFRGIFSPDGQTFLTTGGTNARLWNTKDGGLVRTFSDPSGGINWSAFSSDGKKVLLASSDNTATLWDASSGNLKMTFAGHSDAVYSAVFSREGQRVVTASKDRTARVWDANTGVLLDILAGHHDELSFGTFLANDNHVATASDDETVRLWDLSPAAAVFSLKEHGVIHSADISLDGTRIVTNVWNAPDGHLWNGTTGTEIAKLSGSGNLAIGIFSRDNRMVLTGSYDSIVQLWDAQTGMLIRELPKQQGYITDAAFSPDGDQVAIAYNDDALRVWNTNSGILLWMIPFNSDYVTVAYSPDGTRLAIGGKYPRIAEAKSGLVLHEVQIKDSYLSYLRFSTDGKWIVDLNAGTAELRIGTTGALVRAFDQSGINFVDISADSKLIATAGEDHTAKIWDTFTGALIHTLVGHGARLVQVRFSKDGRRIITSSNDRTSKIWEIKSGILLETLRGHSSTVAEVKLSNDDGRLVTIGSSDDTALVWNLQPPRKESTVKQACRQTLLHSSVKSLALLTPMERAAAPAVDPTADFSVEGDVCTPASPWTRLAILLGIGNSTKR